MEFIVNSLKQLATNISTSDIIVLLALIGLLVFYIVKYVIKYGDVISNIFRAGPDKALQIELEKLNSQFDDIASVNDIKNLIDKDRSDILQAVTHTTSEMAAEIGRIKIALLELNAIKDALEREQEAIIKSIDAVKANLSVHENTTEHNYSALIAQLNKNHDAIIQAVSRIEKIDEFVKTAIPEFRTYHRELNNEVRDLNRDIALIGLHASMNSGSGTNPIKLR